MGDAEQLVQNRVKPDLAPPPVIIVFAALTAHEEPPAIDLAPSAHNGDGRAGSDSHGPLLFDRQPMPTVYRKFAKSNRNGAGTRANRDLVEQVVTELTTTSYLRPGLETEGIVRRHSLTVDLQADARSEEVSVDPT